MINETILAIIIAFVISAALCPVVIPMLHKLKFGQQVRQEGPQAHLKKQGTPTMGGLIILGSIIVTSLFYLKDYKNIEVATLLNNSERTILNRRKSIEN